MTCSLPAVPITFTNHTNQFQQYLHRHPLRASTVSIEDFLALLTLHFPYHLADQTHTKIMSNGAVTAIVTLVATCPLSIALLFHLIKRACLHNQPKKTDVELANRPTPPTINILVNDQLDLLVPWPGLAYVPGRQSPTSVGSSGRKHKEQRQRL
ncbi:hypothetical protein BKA58DRAFT_473022 [Alternaria rosae]|uniref:uncharacterized protein n=1 Tax=Alternaria rosae TaxID=1187941 RepID=UPI001E8DBC09|nr:uncharacterized protein BKA58DRAFT_473022 [Alternaria rosae]KAH6858881.1 hypothetical protein BKA58DRAFT_473022 [Alternaria rosae]